MPSVVSRRRVLATGAGVGFLAAAAPALAQPKAARVGVLIAGDVEPSWTLIRKGMTGQGLIEGRNVQYEMRNARPFEQERLDAHAAALVALKPDVLVAVLTPAILALQRASKAIPTAFFGANESLGLVSNIARPEGNLTGVYGFNAAAKTVQLLREFKPATRTIGVLLNVPDPFHVTQRQFYADAAREQNVEMVEGRVERGIADLPAAFDRLVERKVDAVFAQPSLPLREVAELALRHRLPSLATRREFVEVGGLMAYSSDIAHGLATLAGQVARLLKGTPVVDVPVQFQSKFEMILNQKTARALGITFSPLFLGRVDEVVE